MEAPRIGTQAGLTALEETEAHGDEGPVKRRRCRKTKLDESLASTSSYPKHDGAPSLGSDKQIGEQTEQKKKLRRQEPSREDKDAGVHDQLVALPGMIESLLRPQRDRRTPVRLRPSHIMELHRLCTVARQPDMCPGAYRSRPVRIRKPCQSFYVPPPPEVVPGLVEDLCDEVNTRINAALSGQESQVPGQSAELVAYCMYQLSWIHPFLDANGRVSRALGYLVMAVLLGRDPGLAPLIPYGFRLHRKRYLEALRASDASDLHLEGEEEGAQSTGHGSEPRVSKEEAGGVNPTRDNGPPCSLPSAPDVSKLAELLMEVWPPLCTGPRGNASAPPALSHQQGAPQVLRESQLSEIREQLGCSICHELLVDPVTAPGCGHSFCLVCIRRWMRSDAEGAGSCPCCRVSLPLSDQLVVSVTLRSLAEQLFPEEAAARKDEASGQEASPPRYLQGAGRGLTDIQRLISGFVEATAGSMEGRHSMLAELVGRLMRMHDSIGRLGGEDLEGEVGTTVDVDDDVGNELGAGDTGEEPSYDSLGHTEDGETTLDVDEMDVDLEPSQEASGFTDDYPGDANGETLGDTEGEPPESLGGTEEDPDAVGGDTIGETEAEPPSPVGEASEDLGVNRGDIGGNTEDPWCDGGTEDPPYDAEDGVSVGDTDIIPAMEADTEDPDDGTTVGDTE